MLKPFIIEMKDREIVKNITPIKDPEIKCAYDNVYPPADDTYLIIDYFKKRLTNEYFDGLDMVTIKNIVEIGTGTGIIAIFLQLLTKKYIKFKPKIYASDILQESIDCAKINQGLNNIDNQITLIKSNLFESFPKSLSHSFNIIIFNPPYLPSSELVEQNEEKRLSIVVGMEVQKELRFSHAFLRMLKNSCILKAVRFIILARVELIWRN